MTDYTIYYKERMSVEEFESRSETYDVSISGFEDNERSEMSFAKTKASRKMRFAFPEHGYTQSDVPNDVIVLDDDDQALAVIRAIDLAIGSGAQTLCLDITSILSHYVLVFVRFLWERGIQRFDVVYGEPTRYVDCEETQFSDGAVTDVVQAPGFEGVHEPFADDDLLVVSVGYDHALVASVASAKDHAKKVQIYGFPSLRPDMYQEGLLRAQKAAEAIGGKSAGPSNIRYAPASDPFVTASVVSEVVARHRKKFPNANVYLAPLATKAQTLGFAIYYICECLEGPTSILHPTFRTYSRTTSEGISGFWKFVVELPSK